MKKQLFLFFLFSSLLGFSQRGINYSAIIKDNAGTILVNQNVTLEFSILQGVSQTLVYTETHSVTTNDYGYVNAVIGAGTPSFGAYNAINWGNDIHFINTKVNTGSGFVSLGITELKAVPYALYAETSGTSSSGAFTSNSGLTKINTESDDFLLGSNQLNFSGVGVDTKAFYDEGLGAFRVGGVTSNNWDTSNVGLRSFASGFNTRASLTNAVAFGDNSQATGQTSFVMGTNTQASALNTFAGGNTAIASGSNSFAYGNNNNATGLFSTSFGERTTAQARGSFVIGRFNEVNGNGNTWVATDPLFVVGNGASDTNRSNALTVYKDGSLETGGLFTIGDPINGNSYTFPAEDALMAGQVLTSDGNGQLTWQSIATNSVTDADSDTSISVDDGTDNDKVEFKTNGTTEMVLDQTGLVLGSYDKLYNPATLNSKRMFYDKNKSALRGGFNDNTSWDDANVGLYSFSFGDNTRAIGQTSAAFGGETVADYRAFAIGWQSKALGSYSFAGGWQSESLGTESFAFGDKVIATGVTSTAFGENTTASGMNSFVVNTGGTASGSSSFSANSGNIASHSSSATFGTGNRSNGDSSFTIGKYNQVVPNSLFVVGDGTSDTSRSNAFQIKDDGKVVVNDLQSTERRNVEVLADGTLTTSSKTKKIFLIGSNLVPFSSGADNYSSFSQPGTVTGQGPSWFDGTLPINLPQGATIKAMKFYIKEASASSSTTVVTRIRIREYFNNGSSLTSSILNTYNATSPNNTGVEQRITTGILSLFHSPERTFFLEVRLGEGDEFRGVEIEYIEP